MKVKGFLLGLLMVLVFAGLSHAADVVIPPAPPVSGGGASFQSLIESQQKMQADIDAMKQDMKEKWAQLDTLIRTLFANLLYVLVFLNIGFFALLEIVKRIYNFIGFRKRKKEVLDLVYLVQAELVKSRVELSDMAVLTQSELRKAQSEIKGMTAQISALSVELAAMNNKITVSVAPPKPSFIDRLLRRDRK